MSSGGAATCATPSGSESGGRGNGTRKGLPHRAEGAAKSQPAWACNALRAPGASESPARSRAPPSPRAGPRAPAVLP
eukprot:2127809-Prymnesium_polylepis.1